MVTGFRNEQAAGDAGIHIGDVILNVDGEPVNDRIVRSGTTFLSAALLQNSKSGRWMSRVSFQRGNTCFVLIQHGVMMADVKLDGSDLSVAISDFLKLLFETLCDNIEMPFDVDSPEPHVAPKRATLAAELHFRREASQVTLSREPP